MKIVLIVGGGSAGLAAAYAAKESGANVLLFEEGLIIGERKSLLPYLLSGEVTERDIRPAEPKSVAEKMGIQVRLGEQVHDVDLNARMVRSTKGRSAFDALVLATGTTPDTLNLPGGAKKEKVFTMRGFQDYRDLADALGSLTRIAILGSTPISFLVADLIFSRGIPVNLFVPRGPSAGWEPFQLAANLARRGAERGVDLIEGSIEKVVGVDRAEAVISNGRVYACDGVVIFPQRLSRIPKVDLALGRQGGMLVDDRMRTSAESVYAAGDCADMKRGDSTLSVRLQSASTVMGAVAGTNAAGGNAVAHISGAISQTIFGVDVCGAGLNLEQARSVGLDPLEVTTSSSGPGDPFGSEEVSCTMIVDRSTLGVCGISVIGFGARSHADALSLIVSSGMKVTDLAHLETAYSPKNSSDQSPISLTARRAVKLIGAPP